VRISARFCRAGMFVRKMALFAFSSVSSWLLRKHRLRAGVAMPVKYVMISKEFDLIYIAIYIYKYG
jgi:hypothetical protein